MFRVLLCFTDGKPSFGYNGVPEDVWLIARQADVLGTLITFICGHTQCIYVYNRQGLQNVILACNAYSIQRGKPRACAKY